MADMKDIEKNAQFDKKYHQNQPPSISVRELCATPPPEEEDESTPPDGGLIAWLQVIVGTLINAVAWGYPSAFGVFQLHYSETLHLPAAQISWIGSIQTFLTYLMSTLAGRLTDAGYARETTIAGSLLAVLGIFMTSLSTRYWQIFLSQGICTGVGLGLIYMPSLTVMSSYFSSKRSTAMAITAIGTSIGSAVYPAVVEYLVPSVGYAWSIRCCGFVSIAILVFCIVFLRPRLAPRKSGPLVEWGAFKEPVYVLYSSGSFFIFWALYFGYFYINTFATDRIGFSSVSSAQLLIITSLAGIPTRPLSGIIADRWLGPLNTYILSGISLGAVGISWMGVTTKAGMYVFVVFYGLANGITQGVFGGALASLTKDPRKMGTRYGMVCTLLGFATLAGPPTAGAIIDKCSGEYTWAQVWAGAVTVLGALTAAAARWWLTGKKVWTKI